MEKLKEITEQEHNLICKIFEVEHPAQLGEITLKRLVMLIREAKKDDDWYARYNFLQKDYIERLEKENKNLKESKRE